MLYAKQIPPEYQDNRLFDDDFYYQDVILTGNRYFIGRLTDEYEIIDREIDLAIEILWEPNHERQIKMLEETFPPRNGLYTEEDRKRWVGLLRRYMVMNYADSIEPIMCEALSLMTGEEYQHGTLRGCAQGDWQGVYYPKYKEDLESAFLQNLETFYFNLGSEWLVYETDSPLESVEDVADNDYDEGIYLLTSEYYTDDVKQELSKVYGVPVDQIVLFKFDGWIRQVNYETC